MSYQNELDSNERPDSTWTRAEIGAILFRNRKLQGDLGLNVSVDVSRLFDSHEDRCARDVEYQAAFTRYCMFTYNFVQHSDLPGVDDVTDPVNGSLVKTTRKGTPDGNAEHNTPVRELGAKGGLKFFALTRRAGGVSRLRAIN